MTCVPMSVFSPFCFPVLLYFLVAIGTHSCPYETAGRRENGNQVQFLDMWLEGGCHVRPVKLLESWDSPVLSLAMVPFD